jgi:alpha-glucosidase
MPVARHPWLQYPEDANCEDLARQYFLGPNLLVAPVLDEGARSVRAYLPAASGTWRHRWSGVNFEAGEGKWVTVDAPLGQPGLFDRVA